MKPVDFVQKRNFAACPNPANKLIPAQRQPTLADLGFEKKKPTREREVVFIDNRPCEVEIEIPSEEQALEERDQSMLKSIDLLYPPEQAAELKARYRPRNSDDPPRASRPAIPMTPDEACDYFRRFLGIVHR